MTVAAGPLDEALETGWFPGTPVHDTLLRQFVFNHADYVDAVAASVGARVERTDDVALADTGRPAALFNSATLLRPLPPDAFDRVVTRVERFFDGGRGPAFLWSAWPTPDLAGRGWQLSGYPPLLVRHQGLPLPEVAPVPITTVTDTADLRTWERIVAEGFPFPDAVDALPGAIIGPDALGDDRLDLWLAYAGDRPVTAAALFRAHGLAQFAFGVTLPQARRTGHWGALVRHRLEVAGSLPSAAVFSDDSRPGAQRYGFLPVLRFTLWMRDRP